jgi:hypothetical protein
LIVLSLAGGEVGVLGACSGEVSLVECWGILVAAGHVQSLEFELSSLAVFVLAARAGDVDALKSVDDTALFVAWVIHGTGIATSLFGGSVALSLEGCSHNVVVELDVFSGEAAALRCGALGITGGSAALASVEWASKGTGGFIAAAFAFQLNSSGIDTITTARLGSGVDASTSVQTGLELDAALGS